MKSVSHREAVAVQEERDRDRSERKAEQVSHVRMRSAAGVSKVRAPCLGALESASRANGALWTAICGSYAQAGVAVCTRAHCLVSLTLGTLRCCCPDGHSRCAAAAYAE